MVVRVTDVVVCLLLILFVGPILGLNHLPVVDKGKFASNNAMRP